MPENFTWEDDYTGKQVTVPVATEDELLEFCNKIRKAGGAYILEALLPSRPGNSEECLIARGLNFNCSVRGTSYKGAWADHAADVLDLVQIEDSVHDSLNYNNNAGSWAWFMKIQYGDIDGSSDRAKELATELELKYYLAEILLPEHIGNAAAAFDKGVAFTQFNLDYESSKEPEHEQL